MSFASNSNRNCLIVYRRIRAIFSFVAAHLTAYAISTQEEPVLSQTAHHESVAVSYDEKVIPTLDKNRDHNRFLDEVFARIIIWL